MQEVDEEGDGEDSAAASSRSEHDIRQQFEKFIEKMDRQKPHPSKPAPLVYSPGSSPASTGAATAIISGSPVSRGALQVHLLIFKKLSLI